MSRFTTTIHNPSTSLCDIDLSDAFLSPAEVANLILSDLDTVSIPDSEAEMFADLIAQAEQAWDDVDLDDLVDSL